MEAYNHQDSEQRFRYVIELIKHTEKNKGKETFFIKKHNKFKRLIFFIDRKNKYRKIIVFLSKKSTKSKRKTSGHVFKITEFSTSNNEVLFENLRKENQEELVSFFEEKFIENS